MVTITNSALFLRSKTGLIIRPWKHLMSICYLLSFRHWSLLLHVSCLCTQVLQADLSLGCSSPFCPELLSALPEPPGTMSSLLVAAFIDWHTLWHQLPACLSLLSGLVFVSPDEFTRSLELSLIWSDRTRVPQTPWWQVLALLIQLSFTLLFLINIISATAADLSALPSSYFLFLVLSTFLRLFGIQILQCQCIKYYWWGLSFSQLWLHMGTAIWEIILCFPFNYFFLETLYLWKLDLFQNTVIYFIFHCAGSLLAAQAFLLLSWAVGYSLVAAQGFSLQWLSLLHNMGSRAWGLQ